MPTPLAPARPPLPPSGLVLPPVALLPPIGLPFVPAPMPLAPPFRRPPLGSSDEQLHAPSASVAHKSSERVQLRSFNMMSLGSPHHAVRGLRERWSACIQSSNSFHACARRRPCLRSLAGGRSKLRTHSEATPNGERSKPRACKCGRAAEGYPQVCDVTMPAIRRDVVRRKRITARD